MKKNAVPRPSYLRAVRAAGQADTSSSSSDGGVTLISATQVNQPGGTDTTTPQPSPTPDSNPSTAVPPTQPASVLPASTNTVQRMAATTVAPWVPWAVGGAGIALAIAIVAIAAKKRSVSSATTIPRTRSGTKSRSRRAA